MSSSSTFCTMIKTKTFRYSKSPAVVISTTQTPHTYRDPLCIQTHTYHSCMYNGCSTDWLASVCLPKCYASFWYCIQWGSKCRPARMYRSETLACRKLFSTKIWSLEIWDILNLAPKMYQTWHFLVTNWKKVILGIEKK